MSARKRIGLVGARGHVGVEMLRLLARHPQLEAGFVSSRELAGQRVVDHVPEQGNELRYRNIDHDALGHEPVDAYVLALPNGKAAGCMEAIDAGNPQAIVVDLSADFRFDESWYYGLPELTRGSYRGQKRISNPGCYASAMQLAIAPMRDLLAGAVQCFGVSGYSGAGTAPSDKNDPTKLRDNLMPYALTGHLHEQEVTRHLVPVEFMPHVAAHFRGLTVTSNLHLREATTIDDVRERYRAQYGEEPLIEIIDEAPWVSRIANRHGVQVGGFALSGDGRRLVVVSTLDNLLKGAATQALQNLNLAFDLDEFAGIPLEAS